MKVRLLKEIQGQRNQVFQKGSVQEVFIKRKLWMRELRNRPLDDDEWELVLEDTDLSTEFPTK